MTDAAVIKATFSDWKTVKTRKVLQLIFEVPLEQTKLVLDTLGQPMPHEEMWVAIALLRDGGGPEPEQPKEKRKFEDMPRSQQAGMLCQDGDFQIWLNVEDGDYEEAARIVREKCGVNSRRELDISQFAAEKWDKLVEDYRSQKGLRI